MLSGVFTSLRLPPICIWLKEKLGGTSQSVLAQGRRPTCVVKWLSKYFTAALVLLLKRRRFKQLAPPGNPHALLPGRLRTSHLINV